MTQEQIMELIASHPDGIMQAEVCKQMMGRNGGYVSQQIIQLRNKKLIRRENMEANGGCTRYENIKMALWKEER